MVAAGAYWFSRLQHQTTIFDADTGGGPPREWAALLTPVERHRTENALFLGAKERGASRRVAYRLPEPIGKASRSRAKKHAKKKGSTPSQAPLALVAWPLFMTKVPRTLWKTDTVGQVSPLRWPIEML
jgi:hypothetical protein